MGLNLFLAVAGIEAVFATFCIITRSRQVKTRSSLRIAYFLTFVLLTVLPLIEWSFRYYALTFLLLVLSLLGILSLVQAKEDSKAYTGASVVSKALGVSALVLVSVLPAIIFPQNKAVVETTGDYAITSKTYSFIDTERIESYTDTGENRKLHVQFWYPDTKEGTFPLIVFSHGGLGIRSSNESLYHELASQGYVVCSIDHTYQCFYTTDEHGDTLYIDSGYVKELFAEDARSNIQQSYEYYQNWMKIRTDDMNFIIDSVRNETENKDADWVYRLIDNTRIGVMGHSLGGSAALGIGRIRDDVSAVIALESPFMYDIEGIEDDRFVFNEEPYPVPVLSVYSDSSWSILDKRPQYAANYAMLSDPPKDAFHVYISGVGHLALTDFSLTSPFLTRLLDRKKATAEQTVLSLKRINTVSLAFFNRYLKDTGSFNPPPPTMPEPTVQSRIP